MGVTINENLLLFLYMFTRNQRLARYDQRTKVVSQILLSTPSICLPVCLFASASYINIYDDNFKKPAQKKVF